MAEEEIKDTLVTTETPETEVKAKTKGKKVAKMKSYQTEMLPHHKGNSQTMSGRA